MNFFLTVSADVDNPVVGDLHLTNGQLTLIDGRDAIQQHLTNRLKFFFAEWFLDKRQGLPFYQRVLVRNPDHPAIISIFRRTIVGTPGISAVSELTLDVASDRTASISFVALLDEGGDPLIFTDFILGVF